MNRRNLPAAPTAPTIAGAVSDAGPDEQWCDDVIRELSALVIRCEPTRLRGKLSVVGLLLADLTSVDPESDNITPDEWDREILPRLGRLEDELRRRSDRARGRSV